MAQRRLPLTTAQRGLWVAHQLDAAKNSYNCAVYLDIDGVPDHEVLRTAWHRLREEADVLRVSAMVEDDTGLHQVVAPAAEDAELPVIDLSREPDPVARRTTGCARTPRAPSTWPWGR